MTALNVYLLRDAFCSLFGRKGRIYTKIDSDTTAKAMLHLWMMTPLRFGRADSRPLGKHDCGLRIKAGTGSRADYGGIYHGSEKTCGILTIAGTDNA